MRVTIRGEQAIAEKAREQPDEAAAPDLRAGEQPLDQVGAIDEQRGPAADLEPAIVNAIAGFRQLCERVMCQGDLLHSVTISRLWG
jgi:hypothetical protein